MAYSSCDVLPPTVEDLKHNMKKYRKEFEDACGVNLKRRRKRRKKHFERTEFLCQPKYVNCRSKAKRYSMKTYVNTICKFNTLMFDDFAKKCCCVKEAWTGPKEKPVVITKRTEELTLPPVRKLISLKRHFQTLLSPRWKSRVDGYIKKSLITLYSQIKHKHRDPPCKKTAAEPKKCRKKFQFKKLKFSWDYFNEWAQTNAISCRQKPHCPLPKHKIIKPRPVNRQRILELAKAKIRKDNSRQFPIPIKETALSYVPTESILLLAKPSERLQTTKFVPGPPYPKVSENALKYKASDRIKELAVAKKKAEEEPLNEWAFKVKDGAKSAKPSERIIKLAEPK